MQGPPPPHRGNHGRCALQNRYMLIPDSWNPIQPCLDTFTPSRGSRNESFPVCLSLIAGTAACSLLPRGFGEFIGMNHSCNLWKLLPRSSYVDQHPSLSGRPLFSATISGFRGLWFIGEGPPFNQPKHCAQIPVAFVASHCPSIFGTSIAGNQPWSLK